MILPTKYLPHDRALLSVGAEILAQLKEPRTVSELWECVREDRMKRVAATPLSFDWFVLALNLLYAVTAVDFSNGVVRREVLQ
ncbi:hypothetical protein D3C72_1480040 [compost metagenome]